MDMPKVKFTFNKRGLSEQEFVEALTSKVDELLKNVHPELKKDQGTCIAKVKEAALQEIKARQSEGGSLFGHNVDTTRAHHMVITSGIRRRSRIYRNNIREYHKSQQDLFELFKIKFSLLFQGIEIGASGNNIGYLLHEYNGPSLTASQFCDKVDEVTKRYIQKLSKTTSQINQEKDSLETVVSLCNSIVRLRFANDVDNPNDLMDRRDYRQWKEHLWVLISFGALCVILEMLLIRIKRVSEIIGLIVFVVIGLLTLWVFFLGSSH